MTIEIKRDINYTTIDLGGRLDTLTAPALENTIAESIASDENLVLNFEGLEYISSAGLRVLLGAQKKLQKNGSMKIVSVCEEVMEVLEMTGFADILTIE